jgi:Glycosyl hydrolase catalytic core
MNRGSRWLLSALAVSFGWGCGSNAATDGARRQSTDGGDAAPSATGDAETRFADGSVVDATGAMGGGGDAGDANIEGSADDATGIDSSGPAGDGGVPCKRGMATNTIPSAAFVPTASLPGLTWWYDWSNQASSGSTSIEFVPMIWGSSSLDARIPAASKFLLTFNEPNFKAQADLTSQQAAADWPSIHGQANGVPIVSPAVNFCGSASDTSQCTDPSVTDPYTYLKDFLADCSGCEVDYLAVHWYNCDLPSLQAYLEGNVDAGGTLQGFVQFGKPIWLTEFSCDATHSIADQKAYMQAAIPYLESDPNIFRYSWFSASPIPNAELMNSDGSLTDLGQTYVSLSEACR